MKRKTIGPTTLCVIVLVILVIPSTMGAQDEVGTGEHATIELLEITGSIDNNYAVTQIIEVLHNPYDHAIEETFFFQIPDSAYITNFSLTIDEIVYYGQVVPKDEAREEYEDSASQGKNAGLVESRGSSLFSFSLNMEENETITVGLRYEDYLVKTLGVYYYNVYLGEDPQGHTVNQLSITTDIISALKLKGLEVENNGEAAEVRWQGNSTVSISYSAYDTGLGADFIVQYETEAPPVDGILLDLFNGEEGYFLHVFSPQAEDVGGAMEKDIIFVLDKSGSMNGEKIDQLKVAFSEITNQLPEGDLFNIIVFDDSIEEYSNDLIPASDEEKDAAQGYIDTISAGGMTNINDALIQGLDMVDYYECRVPIIVFLTDGLPSEGVTETERIRENVKRANEDGTAIFSLGFGYDVDFDFLSALSLENYGCAIRIYEGKDAALQITDFYQIISTHLLTNLVFRYSGGTYEIYDSEVSHLFEGSETVVVGKYEADIDMIDSEVVTQSTTGQMLFKDRFSLSNGNTHPFIERFWAYRKINCLLDQIKVDGEDESLVSDVVNISVQYSFVTPYTSLLIVTDDEGEESVDDSSEESRPPADNGNSGSSNPSQNSQPPSSSNGNAMPTNPPSNIHKNSQPVLNNPYDPSNDNYGGGTMDCETEYSPFPYLGMFALAILVMGVWITFTIKKYKIRLKK